MNEIKVNSSVESFHSYHYFVRTRKAFINQWRIQDSPNVGCQRTRWVQNFPKKLHEIKKNLDRRVVSLAHPRDPPMLTVLTLSIVCSKM